MRLPGLRTLRGRFLLTGCLLVIATIASATWSGTMFARLAGVVDDTLRASEALIEHAAGLAGGLEREDDALLLALAGQLDAARCELAAERAVVDVAFEQIVPILTDDSDRAVADSLRTNIGIYRELGDRLMQAHADAPNYEYYLQAVNPALRMAVADTARLRESGFRAMQASAHAMRHAARPASWVLLLTVHSRCLRLRHCIWRARCRHPSRI